VQEPVFIPPKHPLLAIQSPGNQKRKEKRAKPHELEGDLTPRKRFSWFKALEIQQSARARQPSVQAITPRPEAVSYVSLLLE